MFGSLDNTLQCISVVNILNQIQKLLCFRDPSWFSKAWFFSLLSLQTFSRQYNGKLTAGTKIIFLNGILCQKMLVPVVVHEESDFSSSIILPTHLLWLISLSSGSLWTIPLNTQKILSYGFIQSCIILFA